MKKGNSAIKELAAYGVFGVLTTVVNIAVYRFCLIGEMPYGAANTVAFVASVLFAFFTNKHYVFKSHQVQFKILLSEMIRFFVARLGTFAVETLGLWVMISGMHMDKTVPKYAMTVIVIVLNYFLSKKMVFNQKKTFQKSKKVTGL